MADHTDATAQEAPASTVPLLHRRTDREYECASAWNLTIASRPMGVVVAGSAEEVSAAVRYAGDHDLRVAVRSTGHGAVPLDGSVLLVHTATMSELVIDPVRRTARIGAGVRWQQVQDAAASHGLAAICGSAPGVGAVGYLTGGGLGPLARTYGISSDFVRSMNVVVGDGRILRATPTENEDLFWGLRGGKATLGIVTSLELDLVRLDSFYGGALWFDAADAAAVLRAWQSLCADLPEEGTTSIAIMRLPQLEQLPAPIAGRQTLALRFGWVGEAADGERLLHAVRQAATPLLDDVRERPYSRIGAVHNDPVAPSRVTESSALLGSIDPDALDALVAACRPEVNRQSIVELRQLGGAISRPGAHPSACCHRDAAYSLFISGPSDPEVDAVRAHAASVRSALAPWTRPGLLPNFAASNDPEVIAQYYDTESRHWLQELGDYYDPGHLLDVGQVARRQLPVR